MKRGTTPDLKVKLSINIEDIESVDFLFSQLLDEHCPTKVEKTYPGDDVDYDEDNDRFLVHFSEEDTRTFEENQFFYMDTRVTLTSGIIPETNIVKMLMKPTLFEEDDET